MTANARLDEHAVQPCLLSWQRGYDSAFRGEVGKMPEGMQSRIHSPPASFRARLPVRLRPRQSGRTSGDGRGDD
jgi:hypothetical protein